MMSCNLPSHLHNVSILLGIGNRLSGLEDHILQIRLGPLRFLRFDWVIDWEIYGSTTGMGLRLEPVYRTGS